jgi:rhodanese-related sulfurtransferase
VAKTISRDELEARMERGGFQLVNVLTPDSFERAHIPRSVNVPVNEIEEMALDLWDPDEDVIVYCSSFDCQASPKAAAILEGLGFTNVFDYEGGIEDWLEGGHPIACGREAA